MHVLVSKCTLVDCRFVTEIRADKEAFRASRAAAEDYPARRHEANDDGLCKHDSGRT